MQNAHRKQVDVSKVTHGKKLNQSSLKLKMFERNTIFFYEKLVKSLYTHNSERKANEAAENQFLN
jgi:hypothetical protein